jgi:hypothetical protein
MGELGDKLRAAAEPLLESGEVLAGVCVAAQVSTFKGRQVVLATTDRRLIVQGMNRKFESDGPPISIPPERLAEAKVDGAGDGWVTLSAVIMSGAAVTLRLKTTDGDKLKLMMMKGTGPLAKLGGGEDQQAGIEALAGWFVQHA